MTGNDEEFDELKWQEVNRAELAGTVHGDDIPEPEITLPPRNTGPRIKPGSKVKLIVGEKTWIGTYPDGPWEEQS